MKVEAAEFFREMTLRICGDLEIERALDSAFEYLSQHLPVDAIGLGYWADDRGSIKILAAKSRQPGQNLWGHEGDEIEFSKQLSDGFNAVEWPGFTVANDPNQPAVQLLAQAFPRLATDSAVFLRLEIRGEVIGALLISAHGLGRYTDIEQLRSIREPFAIAMSNALRHRQLQALTERLADDNRALAADLERSLGMEVVGADFGLREVMGLVRQVASSSSPTLLLGETGTGKEVIANAIHRSSPRSQGPMITMQCGAIPDSLLDSELFGYERGAFTGATARKRGRFERADGGTLFLDEVGELSLEAQVRLLRVLQERRFERLGGSQTLEVDVRVIAATHRDLPAMVREGSFREDLWYRLAVLPIQIPPLRLRRQDIPALVRYFVDRKSREMSLPSLPDIAREDLMRLQQYDWPGNVRELQNVVERALILSRDDRLRFPELEPITITPAEDAPSAPIPVGDQPLMTMDEAIAAHIRRALERTGGQIAGQGGAAELLGMHPNTLRFRIKKLGIRP